MCLKGVGCVLTRSPLNPHRRILILKVDRMCSELLLAFPPQDTEDTEAVQCLSYDFNMKFGRSERKDVWSDTNPTGCNGTAHSYLTSCMLYMYEPRSPDSALLFCCSISVLFPIQIQRLGTSTSKYSVEGKPIPALTIMSAQDIESADSVPKSISKITIGKIQREFERTPTEPIIPLEASGKYVVDENVINCKQTCTSGI